MSSLLGSDSNLIPSDPCFSEVLLPDNEFKSYFFTYFWFYNPINFMDYKSLGFWIEIYLFT